MQGFMDLENVKWNNQTKQYSGTSKVVAGETMEIVIAPNGKIAAKVKTNQGKATIEKTSNGLLVLKINNKTNASINWTVVFK